MQLEEQVNEVEQFYQSTDVQLNDSKDKGREKHHIGSNKPLHRVSSREATGSEEMQELMCHFSKILHEASASTLLTSFFCCGIKMESWIYMHKLGIDSLESICFLLALFLLFEFYFC